MFFTAKGFRITFNGNTKQIAKNCGFHIHKKLEISIWATQTITPQINRIIERGFHEMAKKKQAGTNNGFSTKFAVISLDSEGKALCKTWLQSNTKDLDTYFTNLLTDGWKTSFKWDTENDCYIVSSTMVDEDDKNHNVCVTSRSDNPYEAVLINFYKIYVLFDNRKLPVEAAKANWG